MAGKWLDAHRQIPPLPKAKLESSAMTDTSDPRKLVRVCVGCHVGAPEQDGLPAREVTHDLLAAGHPRLNFEFTVFLANLPPLERRGKDEGARAGLRSYGLGSRPGNDRSGESSVTVIAGESLFTLARICGP